MHGDDFLERMSPGSHQQCVECRFTIHAFQGKLAEYDMVCSMSRKGNCRDNTPAESFFNHLKNERVHGTRYTTREDAKIDLFDCIKVFYNRSRCHSKLGDHSPVQFLRDWTTNQHERKMVA